jgi:hypothetical protein
MMRTMKWLGAAAVLVGVGLTSAPAAADGLVAAPADLPAKERAALAQAIAEYKKQNPSAFEAVRQVKGYKPEHYKDFRRPAPLVGRELRRLGPSALLPMLEALAFDVWDRSGATDEEWRALTVGMLEAVGALRDPQSSAVLATAFSKASHPDLQRFSAEAVGQLCDDAGLSLLKGALSGNKRSAAIAGLGECRRGEAASLLVAELDKATTPGEAEVLSRALGVLSSSWAWQTLGPAKKAEGLEVGRKASEALVRAFVRFDRKAREAAQFGLTMASHPNIRAIAQKQRGGADAATSKRLDALVDIIERRAKK